MQEVNIYVYTTIKGPQRQDGAYTYVLDIMTSKGPATCSDTGTLNKVTEHQAYLLALAEAMKRLYKHCSLIIHMDSVFIATCAEKWLGNWRKNEWKNAKRQQVSNKEVWKMIALMLDGFTYRFVVGGENPYLDWMKAESKKEKERSVRKCSFRENL